MLIAVIGGKLQGVEIIYLAQKAGYKTLLIDKNPDAVAIKLCDQFLKFKFSLDQPIPPDYPSIDLILPAVEDDEALAAIQDWAGSANIPIAFDLKSYKVSSSKTLSDDFFRRLKLAVPRPWPDCSFPVVVKPDQDSGSRGVEILLDLESLNHRLSTSQTERPIVIQEYLQGPSYSIEVIGKPGNYQPLQVTEIHMDDSYDCKRVTSPTGLAPDAIRAFENIALTVAEAMKLHGIMDFEVVLHDNELKLLEIDARFPSQTPIAVYWSTGVNMVRMLCELFTNQKSQASINRHQRYASIEHIKVQSGMVQVQGEHIMSSDTALSLKPDFFGADEALTNYQSGKRDWVATMIFTGNSSEEVTAQRERSYEKITATWCSIHEEHR